MTGRTYYFDGFRAEKAFELNKLAEEFGLRLREYWIWTKGTHAVGSTYEAIVFNESLGYPHTVGYVYHGPDAADHTDPRVKDIVFRLKELCGSTSVVNGCSQPYDMSLFVQASQPVTVRPSMGTVEDRV